MLPESGFVAVNSFLVVLFGMSACSLVLFGSLLNEGLFFLLSFKLLCYILPRSSCWCFPRFFLLLSAA